MFSAKKQKLAATLLRSAVEVEAEAKKLVAIDTGKLLNSIGVGALEIHKNSIAVPIFSRGVSYAKFVERGAGGREKNYHRFDRIVFTGNGQKFLSRAVKNKSEKISQNLKNAF